MLRFILPLLFIGLTNFSYSQDLPQIRLQIIAEESNSEESAGYEQQVEQEIQSLLSSRYSVSVQLRTCDCSPATLQTYFTEAFEDAEVDLILAIGPMASAVLSQQKSFPKPSIAGVIINPELQNVPLTPENTSGVNNFTYIQSPFSLDKDLRILHQIYPYKNITVISPKTVSNVFPNFQELYGKVTDSLGSSLQQIVIDTDAATTLAQLPENTDAVYLLPMFDDLTPEEQVKLMEGLIERKLPSVGLFGDGMVRQGALIGYQSEANLGRMPRRVALNVLKILEGTNAADLSVVIETYGESTIINMATARKLKTYPDWDLMNESVLIGLDEPLTDRSLTIESVVADALANNLSIKIAEYDPRLSEREVALAKAELLPQLDLSSTLSLLDKMTAENSFGGVGRVNWQANGSLSQLVFSEPALANIAIQKLLKEGAELGLQTTQLDIVQDVTAAYLSILQAKSFVDIQNENVTVTKQNYDIAKAKEAVGYSGASDINRWQSELALNKVDLNDAQAQYRQAGFQLNALLNDDINADFYIEGVDLKSQLLFVTDPRVFNQINNEGELDVLADFLVSEAMNNLPELQQVGTSLAAQERLLLSQRRKNYMPSLAISGGIDYYVQRWDRTAFMGFPLPGNDPTWNLGLGLQYPIFQGGKREQNIQIAQLNVQQIKAQQADLRNQLEVRVRAALEVAAASYYRVERFDEAAIAARKNFNILQDAYSQGVAQITALIDAQNAAVQTELGAVNATYQFINDFFQLERSTGFYYMISSQNERNAFFDRMDAFMASHLSNN